MELPNCFKQMSRIFDQDVAYWSEDKESLLTKAISQVQTSDRDDLAMFIDRLLDAGPIACEEAWNSSDSDVFILNDGGLVQLLQEIRARL